MSKNKTQIEQAFWKQIISTNLDLGHPIIRSLDRYFAAIVELNLFVDAEIVTLNHDLWSSAI